MTSDLKSPPVHDSDIIYLAIRRLERVAEKMQKFEYDAELERLMNSAAEWFGWAAHNMSARAAEENDLNTNDPDRSTV